MKKILTSALAIVLFVGASQAQTTSPRKDHQRGPGMGMMKDLNLTDAQKTQLKSLREAEKKDMNALKTSGNVTPEQRKALHEKYRSQFDAVLTPAQKDELNKKKAEWKAKGDKDGKGFGKKDGAQMNHLPFNNKALNLSADQQTKLKSMADEFRTKAKDIRGNSTLSDEQKKAQMHDLTKQFREQSKTVLNADQQKKMDEMRKERKDKMDRNS
jgi:Spy/CpxP family protein refolding chaperone